MEKAVNFLFLANILADLSRIIFYFFLSPLNIRVNEFNQLMIDRTPGDKNI